jgi:DNA-binding CsgD family transcriptional regulator
VKSLRIQLDFYYQELAEIDGVKLTHRQIDVASCIIGRQRYKVISKILSISPSTLDEHLKKLKEAIRNHGNDQLDVLTFLEISNKYGYLKNHYVQLLIQQAFVNILGKIAQEFKPIRECVIYYGDSVRNHNILSKKIREHLKILKVDYTVIKNIKEFVNSKEKICLYVTTRTDIAENENRKDDSYIYLVQSNHKDESSMSYYDSFFELLYYLFNSNMLSAFYKDFIGIKQSFEKNLSVKDVCLFKPVHMVKKSGETNISMLFNKRYLLVFITGMLLVIYGLYNWNKHFFEFNQSDLINYQDVSKEFIYSLPPRNLRFVGAKLKCPV